MITARCFRCSRCCFVFQQKTAYEMRIRDWSSDVCSSDLLDDSGDTPSADLPLARSVPLKLDANGSATTSVTVDQPITEPTLMAAEMDYEDANGETLTSSRRIKIGRASCRERVCQYV